MNRSTLRLLSVFVPSALGLLALATPGARAACDPPCRRPAPTRCEEGARDVARIHQEAEERARHAELTNAMYAQLAQVERVVAANGQERDDECRGKDLGKHEGGQNECAGEDPMRELERLHRDLAREREQADRKLEIELAARELQREHADRELEIELAARELQREREEAQHEVEMRHRELELAHREQEHVLELERRELEEARRELERERRKLERRIEELERALERERRGQRNDARERRNAQVRRTHTLRNGDRQVFVVEGDGVASGDGTTLLHDAGEVRVLRAGGGGGGSVGRVLVEDGTVTVLGGGDEVLRVETDARGVVRLVESDGTVRVLTGDGQLDVGTNGTARVVTRSTRTPTTVTTPTTVRTPTTVATPRTVTTIRTAPVPPVPPAPPVPNGHAVAEADRQAALAAEVQALMSKMRAEMESLRTDMRALREEMHGARRDARASNSGR